MIIGRIQTPFLNRIKHTHTYCLHMIASRYMCTRRGRYISDYIIKYEKTASSSTPEPPPLQRDYLGLKSRPDFNLRHSCTSTSHQQSPLLAVTATVFPSQSLPKSKHYTESSGRRCATFLREPFVNLHAAGAIHDPVPASANVSIVSSVRPEMDG